MQKTIKNNFRDGELMVETTLIVETQSAVIDYSDILEACELEPDSDYDPFDCDGLEHEVISADKLENAKDRYGYCWHAGDREHVVIMLDPAQVKEWGVYDYARASGASKQVAKEREALNVRHTIDTISKWYSGEIEGWGVTCDFMGENASCWGFDDYDYAYHDARYDIADEIAAGLEARGYTVENQPNRKQTRYGRKWSAEQELNAQSFVDYVPFDYSAAEREFTRNV